MNLLSVFFFLACTSKAANETAEESEVPTSSEIESAITEANYCETSDDCAFVDSCWCGAVANVDELEELQAMIALWKEVPENGEECAMMDCMPFEGISCDNGVCYPIEGE